MGSMREGIPDALDAAGPWCVCGCQGSGGELWSACRYPREMQINWGELDWAGIAAIAGVGIAIATGVANGYVARDRWKRVERLVAISKELTDTSAEGKVVRGMLYSEVQRLDYQLRAKGYRVELLVGWVARVVGWLSILAGYVVTAVLLQPWLQGKKDWNSEAWQEAWPGVVIAAPGAVLVIGSILLFNGYLVRRKDWIRQHSPLIPPAS